MNGPSIACLFIVFNGKDARICEYLYHIKDENIVKLGLESDLSIADKRNFLLERADGDYFAIWDDDDWYAPLRLRGQMDALTVLGADACVLSRVMLSDEISGKKYLSGRRTWENSLMCKSLMCKYHKYLRYSNLPGGGDTEFICKVSLIFPMIGLDRPDLYEYRFHGGNYWSHEHWEKHILPFAEEIT
jgi:glycosyltransferase involved in cell wall biosynthesis